ncbi:hypothetical protein ACJIZ3_008538 [Penstemon smallii]|uniref:Uncharacterized protein n=1 Tax=Penstemon smallii TaxID=265156 RepID=A0ABD3TB97_9LAMI
MWNRSKHSCSYWLALLVNKYHSIVIKFDFAPITTTTLHCSTNYNTIINPFTLFTLFTLFHFHFATTECFFHRHNYFVS